MTAEQLEELLGKVTPGEWLAHQVSESGLPTANIMGNDGYTVAKAIGIIDPHETQANATLIALAPQLARRVIAAEKLVHEVRAMMNAYHSGKDIYGWADAVSEAIDTWEALK